MSSIVHYLLTLTPLGKWLDNKKTLIGAILMVLAGVVQVVERLVPMFPHAAWLLAFSQSLSELLSALNGFLTTAGYGFLVVGLVGKAAKARLPED